MTTPTGWARIRANRILGILKEAVQVSIPLFKIMIPILIVVKVLKELGLIDYLALPLAPLMNLVGLPDSMGLVWATAILNNLYGAMVVFVNLPQSYDLSTAQVTVLGTMMLIAHNLPLEGRIAQKAGTRFIFQVLVRMGGALLLGWMLHQFYSVTGWLQGQNVLAWSPEHTSEATLAAWGVEQLKGLAWIFVIITALIVMMRLLDALRITELMIRFLSPVLKLLGIGRSAAPITVIGMTMGLAYGGGLIIREADSGKVSGRDVFFSLTLMGLAHSIIEDTLLMMLLGGHLSGLLVGRVVFGLVITFLLVRLVGRVSESVKDRFLYPVQRVDVSGSD